VSEHSGVSGQQADFAYGKWLVFPWGIGLSSETEPFSARWEEITTIRRSFESAEVMRGQNINWTPGAMYQFTLEGTFGPSKTILDYRSAVENATRLFLARALDQPPTPVPGTTTSVTLGQFWHLIEAGVTRAQLPKALGRFDAGETISFGKLTVSPGGIGVDDRLLPWSQVKDARIRENLDLVVVQKQWRPSTMVSVSKVPNYCIFTALVRAILDREHDLTMLLGHRPGWF
jgi:hypothetical protein